MCPECGATLDAATPLDGDGRPSPGDFSICIYCRAVLRFEGCSTLRAATPEEIESELTDRDRERIRRAREFLAILAAN